MEVFLSKIFRVDRATLGINMKSLYAVKEFKYFRFDKELETKSSASSISDQEVEQSCRSEGEPQEDLVSLENLSKKYSKFNGKIYVQHFPSKSLKPEGLYEIQF